jgi:prepilin-type processing-associated H-X9-DG protein
MLPVLGKARSCIRRTRELAAAQQTMIAFAAYANDNQSRLLPGYASAQMVSRDLTVTNAVGERLTGEVAQRYPWRLAPYLNFNFRGLYESDRLLADLLAAQPEYLPLGVNYDYVISLYPSLAMNVAFVGGSDRLGQFDRTFVAAFGRTYVHRIDQPLRPASLIAFASGRAEPQPGIAALARPQGFFRLEPPVFTAAVGRQWAPEYDEQALYPGLNSGFTSLRHDRRAVTAFMDGHASTLDWSALNDMRQWADQATTPAWGIGAP